MATVSRRHHLGAAFLLDPRRPAGQRFSYAFVETIVLGFVVRGATGQPLADYVADRLWRPMGAEAEATWIVDQGGNVRPLPEKTPAT